MHGAGPGLRRHADDRVRQGAGPGRGDDPPSDIGEAVRFLLRTSPNCHMPEIVFTRPARRSAHPKWPCGSWSPPSATPGTSSRRSRWDGRWPRRGHEVVDRDLGGAPRRGRGRRARLHRRRGIPDVPAARPRLRRRRPRGRGGPGAAAAAGGDATRTVVVSDILTLAPALAAEAAGVPLATLIPHIYPVVEPGLPFFAVGLRPAPHARRPRRSGGPGSGRSTSASSTAGATSTRQRERLGLAPIERFHGGISPELALVATFPQLEYPRRWPAAVQVTGPMTFEVAPPGHRAARRRARRSSWSPPAPPTTPATTWCARRWRRSPTSRVRVVATTNRVAPQSPIEVPANAVLVDWLSYSQLMPVGVAGDLPRRPRHRCPGARRGHAGPDLPDHRRHERDRDAGRLGGRRALAAPGASAAPPRCAGPRGASSPTAPSPPAPASWPPGRGSTTAPSAAPSWSRSWPYATGAAKKLRGWDSNPQPRG